MPREPQACLGERSRLQLRRPGSVSPVRCCRRPEQPCGKGRDVSLEGNSKGRVLGSGKENRAEERRIGHEISLILERTRLAQLHSGWAKKRRPGAFVLNLNLEKAHGRKTARGGRQEWARPNHRFLHDHLSLKSGCRRKREAPTPS